MGILFFAAGCLAKKNKWLETFAETMQDARRLWAVRVMLLVLVSMKAVRDTVAYEGPFHTVEAEGRKLLSSDDIPNVVESVFYGLMTMAVSINLIQLFSVYVNFSNKTTKFFSEAAYGVYILHAAVWPVVSYSYVLILRASGVHLSFARTTDFQVVSSDDIGTWRVVLGFLYTFFISNLILWPLAFYLRKLPGLRTVL